ncbi:XrtA/PEP-CTERM system TPR-repeat protein PrsT [Thalassotalea marina]|uniref:PEP-CTERM system TPR-repeat protein PrsT n=1 Tax=Thalassotalea marina TaxID=1673741 RepID=A0A919EME8_9GAMM|nr:XrtA/PEP-CTERM system TPR-repeat protein PrsT [Thalassotalea marina]GHG02547.1 hypothetical protein GCM10017161_34280 [Thalassotalea marina]
MKRHFVPSLIVVGSIMLSGGIMAAQLTNQPYEDALKSFYVEDFDAAVIHLKNALKNNPSHLPSRLLMAEILIAKGDGAGAEVELEFAKQKNADEKKVLPLMLEALLLQSKLDSVIKLAKPVYGNNNLSSKVLVLKGRALFEKNSTSLASEEYREALRLNPNNIEAILGLAQVAIKREQLAQALEQVNQALAISAVNEKAIQLKANIYHEMGDLTNAEQVVTSLIKLNPRNLPALLTRASVLVEQEKHQQALVDIEVILGEIPNEPRANYLKAIVSAALGMDEELTATANHLSTVLSGMPKQVMKENPFYFYLAGLVHFNRGEYEKAQDSLSDYIDIVDDDTRALRLNAEVSLALGETFSAKNYLVKARLLDPDNKEVWRMLGKTYMATQEYEKAERYFLDLTQARPDFFLAWQDLGRLQLEIGQVNNAISSLEKSLALSEGNSETLLLLMTAMQESNNIEQALVYVEQLLQQVPNDSKLVQRKAVMLGMKGQHQQAKSLFEQAASLDNSNVEAVVHLARMDMVNGDLPSARQRLNTALTKFPDSAPLLVEIGDTFWKKSEISQAKNYYDKAYSIDRKSELALNRLLDVAISRNDVNEAISLAKDYLVRENHNANIHQRLANAYMQAKDYKEAMSAFQLAVKHVANKSPVLLNFANAQLAIQDFNGAILNYKKAIAWNNNFFAAYLALIKAYNLTAEPEKALDVVNELSKHIKLPGLAEKLTGDVYLAAKQYDLAEKHYKNSLQIEESQQATFGLSEALKGNNKLAQARGLLEKWNQKAPNSLMMVVALADLYVMEKTYDKAISLYQEQMKLQGQTPLLMNNIAQVYILASNFDLAVEYAEKSHIAVPDHVAIKDTLAWAYTKQGSLEKALPLFREALAIESDNAEIMYHLAVNLIGQNRKNEAKRFLERVASSSQQFNEKTEAIDLLKTL